MALVVTTREGQTVEIRGKVRVVKARNGRVTLKLEKDKDQETSLTTAEPEDYTDPHKSDALPE